jgi:hypothetical protein
MNDVVGGEVQCSRRVGNINTAAGLEGVCGFISVRLLCGNWIMDRRYQKQSMKLTR